MPGVVGRSSLGKRSVILALLAFAMDFAAVVTLALMPGEASLAAQNVLGGVFLAVFLVTAPLAHITGVVFGLMALGRSNDNHVLGIVGIILNGLSLVIGLFFVWAATKSVGAFR